MKMTLRLIAFGLLGLATVIILSCAPPPVSITDRVNMFIASLNGNRSDTFTNMDPNATAYLSSKDPTFWNYYAAGTYAYTGLNTSNPSAVTLTITRNASFFDSETFVMVNAKVQGSDNWLISQISNASSATFFQ